MPIGFSIVLTVKSLMHRSLTVSSTLSDCLEPGAFRVKTFWDLQENKSAILVVFPVLRRQAS